MQIAQSLQLSLGKVNELSGSLLAKLVVGQRLEAIVMTPATIAELVKLKVEDSILQIRTPAPLQQGEKLVLEVVKDQAGKLAFKLLPTLPETETVTTKPLHTTPQVRETITQKLIPEPLVTPSPIKTGQVLEAAIVKVLSPKQILVQPQFVTQVNDSDKSVQSKQAAVKSATTSITTAIKLPLIEIDVSALKDVPAFKSVFKPDQQLNIEVVTTKPLAVRVTPSQTPIADHIKQQKTNLIAKLDSAEPPSSLKQLTTVLKQLDQLPPPLKQQLHQLLHTVSEKKVLHQPAQLQQAINRSGVFLESHLLKQPELIATDFKANLLKLTQVIENVLRNDSVTKEPIKPEQLKSLPADIQTALLRLTQPSDELNQLPAQILTALGQQGKEPAQLLSALLSLLGRKLDASPDNMNNPASNQMSQGSRTTMTTASSGGQLSSKVAEFQQLQSLLKEVQSVTAKVQLNQLSMLKETDTQSNSSVWLMDIPVKDKQGLELMQLRVEQQHGERRSSQPKEDTWQVQLNLETHALGPLQAGINLYAGTVKVILNAAWRQSADLLEQHLDLLQQRLNELGLNVNQLSCHCVPIKPITPLSSLSEQDSGSWVDLSV